MRSLLRTLVAVRCTKLQEHPNRERALHPLAGMQAARTPEKFDKLEDVIVPADVAPGASFQVWTFGLRVLESDLRPCFYGINRTS